MLKREGLMNVRERKQEGWSVSAIAEELSLDRKTVRKYLVNPPQLYRRQQAVTGKIDPYRMFLRERWERVCIMHASCWTRFAGEAIGEGSRR